MVKNTNNTTEERNYFIVHNAVVARNLALRGVVWESIHIDRMYKDRFIFFYNIKDKQEILKEIEQYKTEITLRGNTNGHRKNNC